MNDIEQVIKESPFKNIKLLKNPFKDCDYLTLTIFLSESYCNNWKNTTFQEFIDSIDNTFTIPSHKGIRNHLIAEISLRLKEHEDSI